MKKKTQAPAKKFNVLDWYHEQIAACVVTTWQLLNIDEYAELYLWYRKGALLVSAEKPEGCELATAERVPRNLEREQLHRWIVQRTGRTPCLPFERGF